MNNLRPFRYVFFTIWPNSFEHTDDILDILRNEPDIQILTIRKHTFKVMRDFVFQLYACDTVPIQHLQSKLAYLYDLEPEVINIFAKNFKPQDLVSGKPPFRKKQCQYIVDLKTRIRNLYNPKHKDPEFRIHPLDKGVSHEHVIHASDHEAQVDYYLKLLGHKDGLHYLDGNDEGLSFEKPFHIKRPSQYSFRQIPITSLMASILEMENDKNGKLFSMIKDTPHFLGLSKDIQIYEEYLAKFRFKSLCDDYSVDRFLALDAMQKSSLLKLPPIIVKPNNGCYYILDGVHRSSVFLHHGIENIQTVVFE